MGKTNLLHQISVESLASTDDDYGVIYIDSDNTFSPEKIRTIARYFGFDEISILKKIYLQKLTSSEVVSKSLRKSNLSNIRLIIIDSLTNLFVPILDEIDGSDKYNLFKDIINFGVVLWKILSEYNDLAIIVSNQARSFGQFLQKKKDLEDKYFIDWVGDIWSDEGYLPALGSIWSEYVDNRILIKNIGKDSRIFHVVFSSTWPEKFGSSKISNGIIFK